MLNIFIHLKLSYPIKTFLFKGGVKSTGVKSTRLTYLQINLINLFNLGLVLYLAGLMNCEVS
jgi:hypothetical protein